MSKQEESTSSSSSSGFESFQTDTFGCESGYSAKPMPGNNMALRKFLAQPPMQGYPIGNQVISNELFSKLMDDRSQLITDWSECTALGTYLLGLEEDIKATQAKKLSLRHYSNSSKMEEKNEYINLKRALTLQQDDRATKMQRRAVLKKQLNGSEYGLNRENLEQWIALEIKNNKDDIETKLCINAGMDSGSNSPPHLPEPSPEPLLPGHAKPYFVSWLLTLFFNIVLVIVVFFNPYSVLIMMCTACWAMMVSWFYLRIDEIRLSFKNFRQAVGEDAKEKIKEMSRDSVEAAMAGAREAFYKSVNLAAASKTLVKQGAKMAASSIQEASITIGSVVIQYRYWLAILAISGMIVRKMERASLPTFADIRRKFRKEDRVQESVIRDYIVGGYKGAYMGSTRSVLDSIVAVLLLPLMWKDGIGAAAKAASGIGQIFTYVINFLSGAQVLSRFFLSRDASDAIGDLMDGAEEHARSVKDHVNSKVLDNAAADKARQATDLYDEADELQGAAKVPIKRQADKLSDEATALYIRSEANEDDTLFDKMRRWSRTNPIKFWTFFLVLVIGTFGMAYTTINRRKKRIQESSKEDKSWHYIIYRDSKGILMYLTPHGVEDLTYELDPSRQVYGLFDWEDTDLTTLKKYLANAKVHYTISNDLPSSRVTEGYRIWRTKAGKWMIYDENSHQRADFDGEWEEFFKKDRKAKIIFGDMEDMHKFANSYGKSNLVYDPEHMSKPGVNYDDYDDIALQGDEGNMSTAGSKNTRHSAKGSVWNRTYEGLNPIQAKAMRLTESKAVPEVTPPPTPVSTDVKKKRMPPCDPKRCIGEDKCMFWHKKQFLDRCIDTKCDGTCGLYHKIALARKTPKRKTESMFEHKPMFVDNIQRSIGLVRVTRDGGDDEIACFFHSNNVLITTLHQFIHKVKCGKCDACAKRETCLKPQTVTDVHARYIDTDWIPIAKNEIRHLTEKDIAWFKCGSLTKNRPSLRFDDATSILVGNSVTMNVPKLSENSIDFVQTIGVVTRVSSSPDELDYNMPTDAGYCGCPSLNAKGKVIGVHAYGSTDNIRRNGGIVLSTNDLAEINGVSKNLSALLQL